MAREKKTVSTYFSRIEAARFKEACESVDTTQAAQLLLMAKKFTRKTEKLNALLKELENGE